MRASPPEGPIALSPQDSETFAPLRHTVLYSGTSLRGGRVRAAGPSLVPIYSTRCRRAAPVHATRLSAFLRIGCSVVCLGARILGQFELCSDTVSPGGTVRPRATSCYGTGLE